MSDLSSRHKELINDPKVKFVERVVNVEGVPHWEVTITDTANKKKGVGYAHWNPNMHGFSEARNKAIEDLDSKEGRS